MSSFTTMHVAVSSVYCLSKLKPSLVKNSTDLSRFLTGRFTNILIGMFSPSVQDRESSTALSRCCRLNGSQPWAASANNRTNSPLKPQLAAGNGTNDHKRLRPGGDRLR